MLIGIVMTGFGVGGQKGGGILGGLLVCQTDLN
jgi:hypothetical protein